MVMVDVIGYFDLMLDVFTVFEEVAVGWARAPGAFQLAVLVHYTVLD